ncbi:MAG TPA: bifunctional glutamate N-acetyltransferase/amino-acid acetyltransferase ArgJ [Planctomycetota bacterium]|nr:bifunctional glutamate N-acetyltransferase/amino-acid acetyltransferase ArgJ [Planctomycetota bacterium]
MTSENDPLPRGFRAGAAWCGLRKDPAHPDLGLLIADRPLPAAAVFTRNELCGAHVTLCREQLALGGGLVRAVLVNAKNANCATGTQGVDDARHLCHRLAALLGCDPAHVLMVSTGVIGARLPVDRIEGALPTLVGSVRPDGFADFARAIMTTDTFAKTARTKGPGSTGPFHVAGCAKGAGMIHPDMATMLAFLLTDARANLDLHLVLRGAVERTFHRVTVDGDTSPNDTVLLWTSEEVPVAAPAGAAGSPAADPFGTAVAEVSRQLCRMIARDGEGATRLVTVQVRGAASESEAARVGRTIATSPLVKTAVYGRDPNWGRILSAAGRSGARIDIARARVWIGPVDVYRDGVPHPEHEPAAHAHLAEQEEVVLGVDLAVGPFEADVWTCDLGPDYVAINADYRS